MLYVLMMFAFNGYFNVGIVSSILHDLDLCMYMRRSLILNKRLLICFEQLCDMCTYMYVFNFF